MVRARSALLTFIAVSVGLVALVAAQALPPGVTKGQTLAGITEYTFPNGLHVLLLPDSGSSTITVNVTYLVGSRHEGLRRDRHGAPARAHELHQSTHDRDIKKELDDHGARWNGTTDYDRTNYFETVNASDDNLRWALGLEAERMVNMRMEKALLDTEMTVVRNEFERGENNVQAILEERVLSTAYLWHNYGKSDDRLARRHRARADRSPCRVLPQVLPAGQRRSSRSPGRSIRPRTLAMVARHSARFRGRRERSTRPTRSSRRRTASEQSNCGAWAAAEISSSPTTVPRWPIPIRRRSR